MPRNDHFADLQAPALTSHAQTQASWTDYVERE